MKNRLSALFFAAAIIILAVVQVASVNAQTLKKDYLGMENSRWMVLIPGNDSVAPFYISSKPVTNKEYILFLAWTATVYADYPEVLLDLLPGIDTSSWNYENINPFADSLAFRNYMEHSRSFVSQYTFNPLYLNAAVIGVTWKQANKFCHWLSDRYNEYGLMKAKYLIIDPNQRDENNFTTETFIFSQYEGLPGKNNPEDIFRENSKGFDYGSYLLRPSFHIAAQYELKKALKNFNLVNCFCQEAKGSEFLEPFYRNYLRERRGYIYFDPQPEGDNLTYYLVSDFSFRTFKLPEKITEWCLDSYLAPGKRTVTDIYRGYGYDTLGTAGRPISGYHLTMPQKDSTGTLHYIIVGDNKDRELEVVKAQVSPRNIDPTATPYIFDHNTQTVVNRNGDRYTTFRFAVNAVRKPVMK